MFKKSPIVGTSIPTPDERRRRGPPWKCHEDEEHVATTAAHGGNLHLREKIGRGRNHSGGISSLEMFKGAIQNGLFIRENPRVDDFLGT